MKFDVQRIAKWNEIMDLAKENKDFVTFEKYALRLHKAEVKNHSEIGSFRLKKW